MKYRDSDSNSVVSACVRANNLDCREFNVEKADKTIKCWIPVDTGKTITLGCDVRTPATRYQIDLIVDGVLRDTKLVEKKSPRLRHELFEEAYFREKTLVQRGTMKVMGLSRRTRSPKNVSPEAVGTLEIRLYRNETGSDVHKPSSTSFLEVESWEDLAGLPDASSIDPTHEIQFVGGTSLTSRALNTLKANLEAERLGSNPWLSFKFCYRSYFAAMLAKPKLQASLEPVKELPSSISALKTVANQGSKTVPAQTSNADQQNAEKNLVHPDGQPNKPLRSTVTLELARISRDRAKRNAVKRQGQITPKKIDVVDQLETGNSDGNNTVKRRKTDLDQLRAELAEDRKVMEESKRHADELRRKTDERQRQSNEEWDVMQRLRLKYKAAIEENQRQADAASKELEEMDRAKP